MWDNIGIRLQKLAKVICWIGAILSVIGGIVMITQNQAGQGIVYISMYGLGLVVESVENKGSV